LTVRFLLQSSLSSLLSSSSFSISVKYSVIFRISSLLLRSSSHISLYTHSFLVGNLSTYCSLIDKTYAFHFVGLTD
jgi:hypothetical protein